MPAGQQMPGRFKRRINGDFRDTTLRQRRLPIFEDATPPGGIEYTPYAILAGKVLLDYFWVELPKARDATVSGTGTLTATAVAVRPRTATASGTLNLTATGVRVAQRAATASGSLSLTATGVRVRTRTATASGALSLTATGSAVAGTTTWSRAATASGSMSLLATGLVIPAATGPTPGSWTTILVPRKAPSPRLLKESRRRGRAVQQLTPPSVRFPT